MFEFEGLSGSIKSLKVNRGSQDEADVIATLNIEVTGVPAGAAAYAMGLEDGDEFKRAMFFSEEPNAPRFLALSHLHSLLKVDNGHAIKIGNLAKVRASRVYGVDITPQPGFVCNVSFVLTFHKPAQGYLDRLAGMLRDTVKISLEQDPGLPFPPVKKSGDDADSDDAGDEEEQAELLTDDERMAKEFTDRVDKIGSKRASKMKRRSGEKPKRKR